MKYEKIDYSIVGRFENGIAYGIITRRTVSGYIPEGMEGFAIRKDGKTWHIDHIASGLCAGTSGYKTRELAVKDFKENIEKRINGISAKTIAEMIERHDAAPFDDEVASWQTVNYTSTYEHRIDKIMEAARRAGLICRNNGKSGELNGVTIFGSMEKMQTINKMIAEYEKRDAERAAEDAAPIAKTENVAVLPESKNEERPETISEEAEAAQADPEEMDTTDEEAPRAVGNKPARGPVKPKDFAGESLSGRGWSIVFDSGLQRTRVIVKSEIRETVAPIIQDAGFYWSENMGSYNKKLTHKAHRAALALAEKLNSATA